jgi:hypothetical protein
LKTSLLKCTIDVFLKQLTPDLEIFESMWASWRGSGSCTISACVLSTEHWMWYDTEAHTSVQAKVQLKSRLLLVQKLKLTPKGFTLGVKAEIEKNLFNLPQVTNKYWTLYGLVTSQKCSRFWKNIFVIPMKSSSSNFDRKNIYYTIHWEIYVNWRQLPKLYERLIWPLLS